MKKFLKTVVNVAVSATVFALGGACTAFGISTMIEAVTPSEKEALKE